MAFAPSDDLLTVASSAIIFSSKPFWSKPSLPIKAGAIFVLTFSTAPDTDFPKYLEPPSLNSAASKAPVEAPLGTAARAHEPSSNWTSTSTVGFPLESRISLAVMDLIAEFVLTGAKSSLILLHSLHHDI